MRYTLVTLILSLIGPAAAVRADDAKKKDPPQSGPEETVLLLYVPRGESRIISGSFMVSSADRPWWGWLGLGPDWDISDREVARVRQETQAAPVFGPGVVYECRARWINHGAVPKLHVTSPPKRLDVKGESWGMAVISASTLTHQPNLWRGDYSWLLEKGKDVTELAGEYERLTATLKEAKVASKDMALALAAMESERFVAKDVWSVTLDRLVIDQPGFAKRGELVWDIGFSSGGRGVIDSGIRINAHTAVVISSVKPKPHSVSK